MKKCVKAELIFLKPVEKEMIWGREEWLVSAHEHGDCHIKSKLLKEKTLSELWQNRRDLFGDLGFDKFPLLIKKIYANEDLSVQVHPDDAYAYTNENGSKGKTESWYILKCNRDAALICGHTAKTEEELVQKIRDRDWDDLLHRQKVEAGDFIQIDPGTLHAITEGITLLEIQQNSDITYRIYDYDRERNGKKRELHIEKGLDVITVPFRNREVKHTVGKTVSELYTSPKYAIQKYSIKGDESIELNTERSFKLVYVLEGEGVLNDVNIKKNDCFIIPYGEGDMVIQGSVDIITATV